ncbi:hypothetical protein J18TS1_09600 [Oceanobacillus oncorhynchi subsp. incaldanensis]|uniref:Gfo/Idh/MocA family protein n=1 Tax=Oceanobacillus TaxID=182709 RepID=UPI001B14ACCA|nr:Gfo/Idh/MocA family oxidoreductase [Oceanobacillus oncorhynchi]UUI39134.1 Gfo/Idh/MocA family oxidoreductase [Oceanobacillus oncorhynchi]GIO17860.1 hypothetical protein J18TS1_09600 [Oceanobacillus oncorhynchi subsp. incaldanensis]
MTVERQELDILAGFDKSKFDYLPGEDRYLTAENQPKLKFNLIGTGNIGQEHMKVTILEGRATINGLYDPNEKSIEQAKDVFVNELQAGDINVFESLEEACNDPEADALLICTPNYTHIDVVRVAAKSKKHIFLEKPMTTNLEDAYEIMEIAKDYPSIFQIGLQYRYKPIYVEAIHEALERKSVGDIKTISIMEHRVPFLDKVGQWNKFSEKSGGTFVEKCCHYFDLFNLFAQSKPVEVYATGSQAVNFQTFQYEGESSDIIDSGFVIVKYENGIQCNFNLSMFSPMFYEELVLCGNEGRLKATETERFVPLEGPDNYLEVIRAGGSPSKTSTPVYPTEIQKSGHGGATYYEHVYFVDNILGKTTSTATVEEGFWSIVVGLAAEESLRTGEKVIINDFLAANPKDTVVNN